MKKKKTPRTLNKYPDGGKTKSNKMTLSNDIQINKYGGKILPKYGDGGSNAGKELKNVGLFALDTILAEWAPNAIKQEQYGDTKFGKQLGNVGAVHESFSSQSPISKNVSKMWNDGETGYTEEQKKLYGQVQPIAKTGSKIGEMWTGAALGGAGMSGGASGAGNATAGSGKMAGQMFSQGSQQFLNTQYDPMLNMEDPNDPKVTGTNNYGREQSNPYYAHGGLTQPNAEVEKQENVVTPNGQFGQFNGPGHDAGGIPTNLPEGTKVFSDRLKMPGTKKSFAQLNKVNDTTKQNKIIEDIKSTSVQKATASLMKLAKETNSNKIFDAQEALKQSKIDRYTMRLGGIVGKYPNGGLTDGDPRLTAKVNLNNDPTKIDPNVNYGAYNAYQSYLNKKGLVNDPRMNTLEGRKTLTDESINDFNTNSPYIKQFPNNKIDNNSITAVQKYHKQSDPNVVVDGWVGSQTSQLRYPSPNVTLGEINPKTGQPLNTTKPYPVIWGDKKYELPADKWQGYTPKDFRPVELPAFGDTQPKGYSHGGKIHKYGNDKLTPMESEELELLNPKDFGYANFQDWGDLNRAEFGDTRPPAPKKEGNSNSIDWGNLATQAGIAIGSNIGNIYDLARSKDIEKVEYGKMNPKLLDPTASLRDVDMQRKVAEYQLRDASGGHSGSYLSNRAGMVTSTALAKDKIRRDHANANAIIENSAQQFNIGQKIGEDTVNRSIRGNARNIKGQALSNIGTNIMSQRRDTELTKGDEDRIALITTMYPSIKNNPEMMNYYKSKFPQIWAEIEKRESTKTK